MKSDTKYNPSEIESRWQKYWEENRVYQSDLLSAKRPYYNLMMFPYPSAEGLHVGNMYAFTGADINGRYKRMQGYDVFEPIGLDGFGIHSENYAIKIGKHPAEQAKISQENFYRQLHAIGNGFAWENKLETYDPDYYKWTQWIFTQMFKAGLAYRKKSPVNFCPSCKTVLSDEQVIDGLCERCKTAVEKKDMEQWYFKITKYAEKLLKNLETLAWTNKVKVGQKNWIGKKEGINITYDIDGVGEKVTVFTTAPVNFGMTFLVLAPEHDLAQKIITKEVRVPEKNRIEVEKYVSAVKKKKDIERIAEGKEKTGAFTGLYAVNGINGKKVPVWVSDFVLGHVGTGAVQGCPGHDKNDFQFAKKFGLPIIRVIVGPDGDMSEISKEEQVIEKGAKGKFVNSEFLNGLEFAEGLQKTMDFFESKGWGKRVVTYKLRDWCISRQRYWGAPIPMIYCEKCAHLPSPAGEANGGQGWVAVPEDQLPVLLPPDVKDWQPEGTGKGPLAKIDSFVNVKCPNCKGYAKRETDVCDTFLDSSWYHLRYPSVPQRGSTSPEVEPPKEKLPWDSEITKKWLPVTQYIGGAEHTVLHLLYARFVWMVLRDLGYLDFSAKSKHLGGPASMRRALGWEEPYTRFYAHGLIIAEGAKMSKSRGNVVVPDAYIAKYGADTLRTYLMFLGPFDGGGDFRDTGIAGMYRFLSRVWRLVDFVIPSAVEGSLSLSEKKTSHTREIPPRASLGRNDNLDRVTHRTIKEVTEDMENFRYNTAIAHIMEYVNYLTDSLKGTSDGGRQARSARHDSSEVEDSIKTLLLLLAPFAPHMTEELWQRITDSDKDTSGVARRDSPDGGGIGKDDSIHLHEWPSFDPKYLVEDEVTIIIQVNGRIRDTVKVPFAIAQGKQNEVEKLSKESEKIKSYLKGIPIKKTIFIPGKLINFVV